MNKILGVDQSLSKCAFILLEDGEVTFKAISKTGASKVKTKRKDTTYYDTLQEQIHHVCLDVIRHVERHNPDCIVFEALSFASVGNATRDLASLYGAIRETLIQHGLDISVIEVAPTSLKTFARGLLKKEDQVERDDKGNVVLLKSKKEKKVKMDKKLMVKAVREVFGADYLSSYNYSSGLDDLADATLLALKIKEDNA